MKWANLAYLLLIGGIMLLLIAVMEGEAEVALLLIFPVIYGTGPISLLGILLIMVGTFLLFLTPLYIHREYVSSESLTYEIPNSIYEENQMEKKTKFGGVVLIGPIPIVFGSDKNMAVISVIIAILMLLSFIIFFLFFYG